MPKSMPIQKPGRSEQSVCTPIEFLQAVKLRLGIDTFTCDLAASRENTVARKFYSKAVNSLEQSWNLSGHNWLNPEYKDITPWVKKAWEESRHGAKTAVLVPASVGANWFRDYVFGKSDVLFLNGRLTFIGHTQPYPKDLMLLLYAPQNFFHCDVWTWADAVRKAGA